MSLEARAITITEAIPLDSSSLGKNDDPQSYPNGSIRPFADKVLQQLNYLAQNSPSAAPFVEARVASITSTLQGSSKEKDTDERFSVQIEKVIRKVENELEPPYQPNSPLLLQIVPPWLIAGALEVVNKYGSQQGGETVEQTQGEVISEKLKNSSSEDLHSVKSPWHLSHPLEMPAVVFLAPSADISQEPELSALEALQALANGKSVTTDLSEVHTLFIPKVNLKKSVAREITDEQSKIKNWFEKRGKTASQEDSDF